MANNRIYTNVRVVCRYKITTCEFCKDLPFSEGRCTKCNRPLWVEEGTQCGSIIGYYSGNYEEVLKRGDGPSLEINFICRNCNSITTRNLNWRIKNDALSTNQ